LPNFAERIDVPPSVNGHPSAYFEFVEDRTEPDNPAQDTWSWLCVKYGEAMLPVVGHVDVVLKGDGFSKPATFTVSRRNRRAETLSGEYFDVQLTPLTVKRVR